MLQVNNLFWEYTDYSSQNFGENPCSYLFYTLPSLITGSHLTGLTGRLYFT